MNENTYQSIRVIFIGFLLFGTAYWLADGMPFDVKREFDFMFYLIAGVIFFFFVIKPLRRK